MMGIGVDWGTTNLRAFLYEADQLIDEVSLPYGVRSLPSGGFKRAFSEVTASFPAEAPIFFYGMIGSNHGWREMPYVDCPCDLVLFAQHLQPVFDLVDRKAWMAPGLKYEDAHLVELMRGEEMQLWGALSLYPSATRLLLPGTHSKWVEVQDGQVTRFQTAMTGELYAILREHSIIASKVEQHFCLNSWRLGLLHATRTHSTLMTLIFQARSQSLLDRIQPQHIDAYLSGLLIGVEVRSLRADEPLLIIAEPQLAERYEQAYLLTYPDQRVITISPVLAGHMGILSIEEHR